MTELNRRDLLGAAAAATLVPGALPAAATAYPNRPVLPPGPPGSLRQLATEKGLICGAAVDIMWLKDAPFMAAMASDCNVLGVGNGFTWARTQPTPDGPIMLDQAEAIYRLAQSNNQLCRGHNLVWSDASMPKWLLAREQEMSAAEAEKRISTHIQQSMIPFRGRMISQEVVNEPIYDADLQSNIWFRKLGERYIDIAFHASLEADPASLRIINQDWIELDTSECARRRMQMLGLLERLLKRGVPVQALGIEGHLDTSYPFSAKVWSQFLDEVVGMGLQIIVTEYDINDHALPADIAKRDAEVAAIAYDFFSSTLHYPQCQGLVSQTFTDKDDWLLDPREADKGRKDGLPLRPSPLDSDMKRKPMWYALQRSIREAAKR